MSDNLPVTLNFDTMGRAYGWLQLTDTAKALSNLHEYVLVPSYIKNDDGSFTITDYSLVHRDSVANTKQLEKKYGKGNI